MSLTCLRTTNSGESAEGETVVPLGIIDEGSDLSTFPFLVQRGDKTHCLRPLSSLVIPVNNFNESKSIPWERDCKHGFVELFKLPPGVGGVLILDFEDGCHSLGCSEDEGVNLTPTLPGFVSELEPLSHSQFESGPAEAMEFKDFVNELFISYACSEPTSALLPSYERWLEG